MASAAKLLAVGDKLHALFTDGEYYPAEVRAVNPKRAKAPVKVAFNGYPDADTWLPVDSLKSKKLPKAGEAPKASKAAAKAAPKAAAESKTMTYDYSGLEVGMRIQVELEGTYYAADVVTVAKAKAKAKAPVKIHFAGYGPETDEWVSGDRIRSKALGKAKAEAPKAAAPKAGAAPAATKYDYSGLAQGMRIQVDYEGTWYAADVVTVASGKAKAKAPVKVHYAGMGAEADEWVGGDRIRSKALGTVKEEAAKAATKAPAKASAPAASGYDYSGLEKGMRMQVELEGTWYAAEVVTVKKGGKAPVKVHYVGWGDDADEFVGGDRIRSKALGKTKAEAPVAKPAAKAAGKAAGKGAPKAAAKAEPAAVTKYDYSGLEKGLRIQVEVDGVWYAADVVTVAKGKNKAKAPVKVHFAGYTDDSDIWVGGDKIRSKVLKKA